jgi:hypothetical protein
MSILDRKTTSRWALAGCLAGLVAVVGASAAVPAFAADTGYAPVSPSVAATSGSQSSSGIPLGIPGEFTTVLGAKSFTGVGVVTSFPASGGSLIIGVPKGAVTGPFQIGVTKGVTSAVAKDLKGTLKKDRVLYAFGIVIDENGVTMALHKSLVVTYSNRSIKANDQVLIYRKGKFVTLGGVSATKGEVVFGLSGVTELAIIAPHA